MSESEWPYRHRELPIVARIDNESAEFVQIIYRHRSDPENMAKSVMLTKEDFGARYHLSPSLESLAALNPTPKRELIERLDRLRDMPTTEISDADLAWWLRQHGYVVPSRIREFAATRLEALQAQPVGKAIGDIAAERQRQIAVEGWAPDHDDAHTDRSLAQAGACYVLHDVRCLPMDRRGKLSNQLTPELWPWEPRWWKPKSYRENLVRGAALIVAEIERLDREASRNG